MKKANKSFFNTMAGGALLIASLLVTGCGAGNSEDVVNTTVENTDVSIDEEVTNTEESEEVTNEDSTSVEDDTNAEINDTDATDGVGDNTGEDAEPSEAQLASTQEDLIDRLNSMKKDQWGNDVHSDMFQLLNGLACGAGMECMLTEEDTLSLISGNAEKLLEFYGLYMPKYGEKVADYKAPGVNYEDTFTNKDFDLPETYYRAPLEEVEYDAYSITGIKVDLANASNAEVIEINGKKYLNSSYPMAGFMGDTYRAESVDSIEYSGNNTWKVVLNIVIEGGSWEETVISDYCDVVFYVTPNADSYYGYNVVGYESGK